MAVEKAISIEDQVDLKVRDRSKGMELEVDVQEDQPEFDNFEQLDDGSIAFGMPTPVVEDTDFYANLAEIIDDKELTSVKNDLMGNIDADKESRSEWEKTYR